MLLSKESVWAGRRAGFSQLGGRNTSLRVVFLMYKNPFPMLSFSIKENSDMVRGSFASRLKINLFTRQGRFWPQKCQKTSILTIFSLWPNDQNPYLGPTLPESQPRPWPNPQNDQIPKKGSFLAPFLGPFSSQTLEKVSKKDQKWSF